MSNFKLLHFIKKRKENYSEQWLLKISPIAIAKYVQKNMNTQLAGGLHKQLQMLKLLLVIKT